jgi:Leucine-rich repeat (LRR) protein
MIKPIKFDLKLNNGTAIRTLDDLEKNLTPELFQHFHSGKLAKWLRVRKLDELADKMEALRAAEKEHEVQLFKSLCAIFVSEINEEDARQAMQDYKKSNSQQVNSDDEVEQLKAEIEELKEEIAWLQTTQTKNTLDDLIEWAEENNVSEYKIPRDKEKLTNLTSLDLSSNKLTELPESIGRLTNLTSLSLLLNQLTEFPEWIGKLTNLTELNLSYNQLTALPESIGKLTNLTGLYLGDNQLTEFPEWIGKLTNLNWLNLGDNQLTVLPESIGKLTNLNWLNLSGNQLTALPESIGKLTNLTELELCDNQLTTTAKHRLSKELPNCDISCHVNEPCSSLENIVIRLKTI